MKTLHLFLFSLLLAFFLLPACSSQSRMGKPLPPGQAKKVNASQSAKPYAPGQQKKP